MQKIVSSSKKRRCECGQARPSFNMPLKKKARWCAKCPNKDVNAVNVRRDVCECGQATPSFKIPSEKKARWCMQCPSYFS